MKFTSGYWMTRKEIAPLYAVEYAGHHIQGNELAVYAPAKHITGRGDTLNLGMLTIYLDSPMEDVIKVSVRHFEGAAYRGPLPWFTGRARRFRLRKRKTKLFIRAGIQKR